MYKFRPYFNKFLAQNKNIRKAVLIAKVAAVQMLNKMSYDL